MKKVHVLAVAALLSTLATSAAAQGLTLEFQNGNVRLSAQNVPVSQILSEWAKRGRTTIVNGERIPGPAVTLELQNVPEQQALDIVLRGVSGYLVAARESALNGASSFDRIYILPTSSRPTNAAALPQQPQQPQQALQVQDDFEDEEAFQPGQRGPNLPPGVRLPRDVGPNGAVQPGVGQLPVPGRAPVPGDEEPVPPSPENRPAGANNPFGVAPGTTRPGVITPGPQAPNRPNQ